MKYSAIKYFDISNGPGCRTSLFVSGCTHRCKGCFNEATWDFQYGKEYTEMVEGEILSSLSPDYIAGLTVLGGEPMEVVNQPFVCQLLKKVKKHYPEKNIWIYSGYTYEELKDKEYKRCQTPYTEKILALSDVLVDGKFVLEKKDISLRFRGSSNQRIIDLRASEKAGKLCLSDYHEEIKISNTNK